MSKSQRLEAIAPCVHVALTHTGSGLPRGTPQPMNMEKAGEKPKTEREKVKKIFLSSLTCLLYA